MPYARNDELPTSAKSVLPKGAQTVYRFAFNADFAESEDDESAARIAWAAVENAGYSKNEKTDRWVKLSKQGYRPPRAVQQNAERGLKLRERWGRGGMATGVSGKPGTGPGAVMAEKLSGGDTLTIANLQRMDSYFSNHSQDYQPDETEEDGGPTAGTIVWLLWGGSAGKSWVDRTVGEEEEVEKSDPIVKIEHQVKITKVDEELGIVFGFAILCKQINGEDYFDLQGDNITEAEMLKAAADFMGANREMGEMHDGEDGGSVALFAWPMTEEIAKTFGVKIKQPGLMIGYKPEDEVLAKFKSREYTGFSIEGTGILEVVNE